ncbi:protein of unknown function [Hyphomicrobium sp. MC1]|nr:protein of unknown function [Hyphomicrobium sp. MC1]
MATSLSDVATQTPEPRYPATWDHLQAPRAGTWRIGERHTSQASVLDFGRSLEQKPPAARSSRRYRLIREWHGQTHTVIILDDGVEWRGQRYASLSVVAREITGARWSGPRFFGLTSGASDAASSTQVRRPE